MKRVIVVLLMLLLCVAAASATQDSWRITIKADTGASSTAAASIQLGVYPTALEGLDSQDGSPYNPATVIDESDVFIGAVVPGQINLYPKSIKAPTMPNPEKTWDFYVVGKSKAAGDQIRLRAFTLTSTTMPTETFDGVRLKYFIRMLDNKGMPGAPANGTQWQLPIPTVHSLTTPFWTAPALPFLRLSADSNAALIAEGYRLQLVQAVVPEPSSLMALGAGLAGLAGLIRRRRA